MGVENALVLKTDNGFNGTILSATSSSAFRLGADLFSRNFHTYPKGTVMLVQMNISKTGRRVVKNVTFGTDFKPFAFINAEWEKPLQVAKETNTEREKVKMADTHVRKATEGYYISQEARLTFTTAKAMSDSRPARAVKIMMVGPSGYGKTTLPKVFAQVGGYAFMRMNCATVRDPEEWFGYREAKDGSTVFVRSQFAKALEKGHLVVVLDEFNRLEPWLHNTLFPLLDDDGATLVHDEKFTIGPNVIVVGTMNIGYKYTGVFELDEALLNRFEFLLEVGPMPHMEEVKVLRKRTAIDEERANVIVKTSNTLRQNDIVCSTRTSLLIANMVMAGMSIREGFESAVIRRIPSDSSGNNLRKSVVDLVNVAVGVLEDRELEADVFSAPGEKMVREKVHTLQLSRSTENATLGMVPLIVALRRLPLTTGSMSLRDAQRMAEEISSGKTVTITLTRKPEAFDDLIESFRNVGVGGRYTAN